jgi:DNA-binding protein WhiA
MAAGFTDEVKQELAGAPVPERLELARAELVALLRFGAAVVVSGGTVRRLAVELETVSGATARRAYWLLQRVHGVRPELSVREPGGVQVRPAYRVRVDLGGVGAAHGLGVVDGDGMPVDPRSLPSPDASPPDGSRPGARPAPFEAAAIVRGAFLAAGSVSAPERSPHLEIVGHHRSAATMLAVTARQLIDGTVSLSGADGDRPRVVVKSGATIGELLAGMGASRAFLRWDERRLRRQLRGDATRLANADAANLGRTVAAATAQVRAVEALVAAVGWDGLEADLRPVALARLTSPEASLTDLGRLVDPPLSRSAVHRRLKRLEQLAAQVDGSERPGPAPDVTDRRPEGGG